MQTLSESHIFGRDNHVQLPCAVRGDGIYLFDQSGKRYLDGSGGAAVSCLGHSDPAIRDAMKEQIDQLSFAHTGFFTSQPAEELARTLIDHAPAPLERVYLVSGGSEAIEAAIKLARQYFIEIGQDSRSHIIARRQSYHGNTLGALSAGGNALRRQKYQPLLTEASHISPCYPYRDQRADETLYDYGQRVANELEEEILRIGAEKIMAFIAEPVVGATLGAVPAVPGYFKRIREICDHYGVLLILDEVMCGMGRTGSLYAFEQEDIVPDMVAIAKGLGAGYQPVGALLCTGAIFEAISQGSGAFQHGHTYMGHPVAAAAGLAVLRRFQEGNLVPRVQQMGLQLKDKLNAAFGQHPSIGDIRGRGLFQALEIVQDKASKTPFDPALSVYKKVKKAAFEAGLMCYAVNGTIDGRFGDHILLAPPFIIEDEQLDELVDKLDQALTSVFKDIMVASNVTIR